MLNKLTLLLSLVFMFAVADQAFGQVVVVRQETGGERLGRLMLEEAHANAMVKMLAGGGGGTPIDPNVEVIAPAPRPAQAAPKSDCDNLLQLAASVNVDPLTNEKRAKLLYTQKEWKALAPCLVELRKSKR